MPPAYAAPLPFGSWVRVPALSQEKRPTYGKSFFLVGAEGLEPPTLSV